MIRRPRSVPPTIYSDGRVRIREPVPEDGYGHKDCLKTFFGQCHIGYDPFPLIASI